MKKFNKNALQKVYLIGLSTVFYPLTAAVAEIFKRAIESVSNHEFQLFLLYTCIGLFIAIIEIGASYAYMIANLTFTQRISFAAQTDQLTKLTAIDEESLEQFAERDILQRIYYDTDSLARGRFHLIVSGTPGLSCLYYLYWDMRFIQVLF